MSTASAIPTGTAYAIFTVTGFHKIGGDHSYCRFTMQFEANGSQQVALAADGTTLEVSGEATIAFQLASPAKDSATYLPVGLALKQAGGNGDPQGEINFPSFTVSNGTLTVVDTDQSIASWDFDIVIQRSTDSALSVIDPMINNTNR
jgi:hypothetical protein